MKGFSIFTHMRLSDSLSFCYTMVTDPFLINQDVTFSLNICGSNWHVFDMATKNWFCLLFQLLLSGHVWHSLPRPLNITIFLFVLSTEVWNCVIDIHIHVYCSTCMCGVVLFMWVGLKTTPYKGNSNVYIIGNSTLAKNGRKETVGEFHIDA